MIINLFVPKHKAEFLYDDKDRKKDDPQKYVIEFSLNKAMAEVLLGDPKYKTEPFVSADFKKLVEKQGFKEFVEKAKAVKDHDIKQKKTFYFKIALFVLILSLLSLVFLKTSIGIALTVFFILDGYSYSKKFELTYPKYYTDNIELLMNMAYSSAPYSKASLSWRSVQATLDNRNFEKAFPYLGADDLYIYDRIYFPGIESEIISLRARNFVFSDSYTFQKNEKKSFKGDWCRTVLQGQTGKPDTSGMAFRVKSTPFFMQQQKKKANVLKNDLLMALPSGLISQNAEVMLDANGEKVSKNTLYNAQHEVFKSLPPTAIQELEFVLDAFGLFDLSMDKNHMELIIWKDKIPKGKKPDSIPSWRKDLNYDKYVPTDNLKDDFCLSKLIAMADRAFLLKFVYCWGMKYWYKKPKEVDQAFLDKFKRTAKVYRHLEKDAIDEGRF